MRRHLHSVGLALALMLGILVTMTSALGSTCSTPLTKGSAGPNDPFWLQNIQHQGIAAFNPNPTGYQVFRNVKNFGAVGDGNADDTAAINNAISSGGRCGNGCNSSTITPAIIYFPPGTYKISTPIISFYQTQLIGDARNLPTLLAAPNFAGIGVIDTDPYLGGDAQYYVNQDNFFRSVRNFVIDLRQTATVTGIHWQVSQATSLINIVFQMANQNQGIYMENGSGGFLGDLVFNGGAFGATFGNQQFTVRNLTFNNVDTGDCTYSFKVVYDICLVTNSDAWKINALWNWGWTFQGITINNCQVGFDLVTGSSSPTGQQGVGAEAIIDAVVTNTPIFVRTSGPSNGQLTGSIVLNNIKLTNVGIAVGVKGGATVLNGGTLTIDSWAQGNVYHGTGGNPTFTQGNIASIQKASSLLDSSGRIVGRTHPQYTDYAPGDFVSVRSHGATGNGHTDDTAAIQNILAQYAGCKIIFFDAGTYIVSSTITIPAGTQIVGEAWSVIMGTGSAFTDYNNPKPVIQVGTAGSTGVVEITDMIFTTRGPAAGAIVVEWNVHDPAGQQAAAGAWDTHLILGGTAQTGLQVGQCPTSGSGGNNCFADFLGLHLTSGSSAYLEGMWVWLADHDLDNVQGPQISLWSGRGILSESQGPVWLIGTAEHHISYQYFLKNAKDHYIGLAQTETPYFQPSPVPPSPFITNAAYDPSQVGIGDAWALTVQNSQNILLFGAGFYSFFSDYDKGCQTTQNCQQQIVNLDSSSSIGIYSLTTVDTTWQLSVNAQGVIPQSQNPNGFANTVTAWTRN